MIHEMCYQCNHRLNSKARLQWNSRLYYNSLAYSVNSSKNVNVYLLTVLLDIQIHVVLCFECSHK